MLEESRLTSLMGLKCESMLGPPPGRRLIIILLSCICCSTPGEELADTVVDPSEEAGESALEDLADGKEELMGVDRIFVILSFLANDSAVRIAVACPVEVTDVKL